jgi:hypothetical protein
MTDLTMTPEHPRWKEFTALLDSFARVCNCSIVKPGARQVLAFMGMDVDTSLAYFESRGGFCDCEVLMNVPAL